MIIALATGVLVTAGAIAMPAAQADRRVAAKHAMASAIRPALVFTPAAADPRLAAVFARGGLDTGGFRFTPAETRHDNRAVTVVARARVAKPDGGRALAAEAGVGLAPIAYNLGVALGWRRFGIAGDVGHVDLAGQPGGHEAADVTVTYAGDRVAGRVKGVVDHSLTGLVPITDVDHSYALDVGGSYRLTHNLDLTAGVRYRTDRNRLVRLDDDRRDSQAVYVGTAFRF